MADLLQEVDDVMRQERMEKFWKENKYYIIGFVIGTIVLTGILSGYRSWDNSVKEKQTAAIIALQDEENYPENIIGAELDFRSGLRGIVLMQAAATALGDQKNETALELYQRAADDTQLPKDIQQAAVIASINLALDSDQNIDAQTALNKLQEITQDDKSPWQPYAYMLSAVIQAHKFENYSSALTHLDDALKAPNLPQTLQERIEALQHLYTLKSQNTSETG